MSEKIYKCPLCKKDLTKEEYSMVLQLDKAREVALKEEIKEAKDQSFNAGAKQTADQVELLTKQNVKLQDTIKLLEAGTTAQKAGFENEVILRERLEREFPDDNVEKHGHYGDVLQIVNYKDSHIGLIVFECKRKAKLNSADIRQAYTALQYRKADYAILVTTATRTGKRKQEEFDSLLEEGGVYIIRPAGVMTLVKLLRDSMIFMHRANLSPDQRFDANRKLSNYLTQGQGNLALNTIIQYTSQLYRSLEGEIRQHETHWNEQYQNIVCLSLAGNILSKNIELILSGDEPILLPQSKPPALPWVAPELPLLTKAEGTH